MENTEQTSEQPTPELTVNDLNNVKAIIEAAVRRGTFNANEISGVGAAYDKLTTFLNSISNQKTNTEN
ncbi:MAG: hypothetical protein EBX47_05270 [Synechococcaceae bacterium WB8_1B_057]|nr:hypothetical protein [Synechococcaceae bacterium WB6_1A_059]NDG78827.1 hypothetical protein [Synechococcaceae bacterium WB8_1B_057]